MRRFKIVFSDRRKKIQVIEAKDKADAIRSCIAIGFVGFAVWTELELKKINGLTN